MKGRRGQSGKTLRSHIYKVVDGEITPLSTQDQGCFQGNLGLLRRDGSAREIEARLLCVYSTETPNTPSIASS